MAGGIQNYGFNSQFNFQASFATSSYGASSAPYTGTNYGAYQTQQTAGGALTALGQLNFNYLDILGSANSYDTNSPYPGQPAPFASFNNTFVGPDAAPFASFNNVFVPSGAQPFASFNNTFVGPDAAPFASFNNTFVGSAGPFASFNNVFVPSGASPFASFNNVFVPQGAQSFASFNSGFASAFFPIGSFH